jgi:hypothetical protein
LGGEEKGWERRGVGKRGEEWGREEKAGRRREEL